MPVVALARAALKILLGASAWAITAGSAIFCYARQVSWEHPRIPPKELLYFGYAFSIAGTITGFAASAALGRRRWAVGFGAIAAALLAVSVPIIRWLIFDLTAPNLDWGRSTWNSAAACMKYGSLFGLFAGLIGWSLIPATVYLERHTTRWQFGVLIAMAVALLGSWVLPAVVASLPDLTIAFVGANYRYLYDELLRGAGIGAGTGALCGAVVVGLMARWLGAGRTEGELA